MLNRMGLWLRANVLRRRMEREMREEMSQHLEQSTARLMARGLSAEEARRQAELEFGNVTYLQEEGRYARGTIWLDALAADARFALRHFARRPGTTLTMFVVLAVGMSISTLLFSYVHSYAVRPPLGVALADDLVRIRGSMSVGAAGRAPRVFSEEEFLEYRKLTDTFEAVAGWVFGMVVLDAGEEPGNSGLDARVTFVTENYFAVMGMEPVLGPGLGADDPDDPALAQTAVIGHSAWEDLFGGDPGVIGATVQVNGVPVTIVGVAPERFIGVGGYQKFDLWMPLSARRLLMSDPPTQFRAVARLRDGVGVEAASAAVRVIALRAAAAEEEARVLHPGTDELIRPVHPSTEVVPLLSANGDPMFARDVRLMAFSVGLLGLLVLLVTCTNVSALLTGLATARREEIATRLSLGAARGRIIRQLLTESALLASAAAAAALGIVWLILNAVARFVPALPLEMGITWPATTFTFGIALTVGIIFGLSPALHATRLAIATAMRDSTGNIAASRARLQRSLVVAQIAFTQPLIVLLAAVLLLVVSRYQPGGRTENGDQLMTMSLRVSTPIWVESPAAAEARQQLRATMHRISGRLQSMPGVDAVAPVWGGASVLGSYVIDAPDAPATAPRQSVQLTGAPVAAGYLDMMGIPLVRGRDFAQGEVRSADRRTSDTPVIVGADLARQLWSGADVVGRRLRPARDSANAPALVIVGVVEDPQADRRRDDVAYRIFLPPDTTRVPTLLVRTTAAAGPLVYPIRRIVQEEAPQMVANFRTLASIEDEQRRIFRLITGGVSAAGLMALLLSAIGLYAVVAFSVGQRRREIAVRIAVGAGGRQIVQKFLGDGLRLSIIGLALGLPLSLLGLGTLMGSVQDVPKVPLPAVTAIAALGVLLVAAAAVWIPARRAASVDPAVTLRRE